MICPVCKVDMIAVEYQKIEIDYCTHCQGVWFDCGEVDLLLKSVQPGKAPQSNPLSLTSAQTDEAKRKCPICGRKMKKAQTSDEPKVLIDACPKDVRPTDAIVALRKRLVKYKTKKMLGMSKNEN